MLNAATKENLRRKSAYVDQVQWFDGVPLWSWLDLNLTELCNRRCTFCPRADANVYPNQALHASLDLVRKISDELRDLNYDGVVVLCGYGEPTLHPYVLEVVRILGDVRVELVTNGDYLTPSLVDALVDAGVDYFVVSLYDGPHQVDPMRALFRKWGEGRYLLRDRWHTAADGFGLKLTNRGGTVTVGDQDPVLRTHSCHYLAYQLTLDWNGDVLLCPQDWRKLTKFGNVFTSSLLEIWRSSGMASRRAQLMAGRRRLSPCNACNTDGTLHGFNHVKAWGR